jgi:hypothetical protein
MFLVLIITYKILVLNILFTFVYVSQHNTTKMVLLLLQFRSWVVKNKGFLGVIHVCALFLHTYYIVGIFLCLPVECFFW